MLQLTERRKGTAAEATSHDAIRLGVILRINLSNMGDSNTPFLLTYDQSASASSRGAPTSPLANSPVASTQAALSTKIDTMHSLIKSNDDMSLLGARKRLLEERVFGGSNANVSSSFPVDASGVCFA
jgi:hypothetical protein